MDYYKYDIQCNSELSEVLIAFLGELPFDTFQESTSGLEAYIPSNEHSDEILKQVNAYAQQFDFKFEKEFIKTQNWNAVWESNFQPIIVGDFCGIRAEFHEAIPTVKHEILISPKMAFGTGHHATTYMMIEHMEDIGFSGKKVFDYGCGTGILAILAEKLGAERTIAVDIELPSFENTIENSKMNEISAVEAIHGTLSDVKETAFDIILANINRNVILDSLSSLYTMLNKNGRLIVSGILEKDAELVLEASKHQGFLHLKTKNKGNWISILFEK